MKFLKYNANPYKIRRGDCVTRALVVATNYGYKTITEMLDIPFFPSQGADGVTIDQFNSFVEKYKILKEISEDDFEIKDYFTITERDLTNFGNYGGMTVGFWLENLSEEQLGGSNVIFLCKLKPDEAIPCGNSTKFHAVCGNVKTKKYVDIEDTKDTIVFDIYIVNQNKRCSIDDPRYFPTEEKELQKEDKKYKEKIFKRK